MAMTVTGGAFPQMAQRTIQEDLKKFLAIDDKKLRKIATVLSRELPATRRRLRLALADVAVDAELVTRVIAHYLSRAVPGGALHGRVIERMADDLEKGEGALKDARSVITQRSNTLREVFSEKNAVAFKATMLQQRSLDHVIEFATTVDLRPVFDESHKQVLAFTPAIIAHLTLHSHDCEETKYVQFQLTRDILDEMTAALEDARGKVRIVSDAVKTSGVEVLG